MLRRRSSPLLLSLSLTVSCLATSSVVRAQGGAPAAPAATTGTPSQPPASPSTPAGQRPPLVAPAAQPAPPPEAQPQPAPGSVGAASPVAAINPAHDQQQLAAQGAQRPGDGELAGSNAQEVFSEDWWGRARPIVEMHGYFRTRAELFHNLFLGRHNSYVQSQPGSSLANDPSGQYLWPLPIDQSYTDPQGGQHNVVGCGPGPGKPSGNCYDKTESGANLRLRLNPEIDISDNLRIVTQLDLLNNLVLGSTPDTYAMQPATSTGTTTGSSTNPYPTGYKSAGYNGHAPLSMFATTEGPPTAGVNAWTNSIVVNRAWGEYMTPLGQIRFGRMPDQWGLGMVANAGDGIDSDYQSTVDRIMFITGIKSIDLYFGGAWDFPSSGPTNASPFSVYGGQPYNTCNLCNVNEWVAFIAHKTNPEIQKLKLAQGDLVINGGLYTAFRSQYLDLAATAASDPNPIAIDYTNNNGLEPRQAWALVPDLWVQALWRKFRFEAEAVTIQGQIGYLSGAYSDVNNPVNIRQYGLTTQTEYRAIDDKLDLQFGFGWASGDPNAENNGSGALQPPTNGLQPEYNPPGGYANISTFAFHPDYRVDLIFFREILGRVEGAYYFRPSVDYDFLRHPDGEKLGGGAAVIWSRASEFVQTPGHKRDLGVELDAQIYYQSKDGSINDDPSKIGGFFTMLQYGVFFPLGGLDYLPGANTGNLPDISLSAAQEIRLFLGVVF